MKAKVLFADDSPSVRLIIKGILQSGDFDLIECEDGQVAIDYLQDHTVDLIITDLFMPNADGFDVIAAARATASTNRFTPIVMVTTESQADRKREGRSAGATAWIVKPFNAELLLKVVGKCLKIK
jgi:two-component system chemotaxis response regulator CheY